MYEKEFEDTGAVLFSQGDGENEVADVVEEEPKGDETGGKEGVPERHDVICEAPSTFMPGGRQMFTGT